MRPRRQQEARRHGRRWIALLAAAVLAVVGGVAWVTWPATLPPPYESIPTIEWDYEMAPQLAPDALRAGILWPDWTAMGAVVVTPRRRKWVTLEQLRKWKACAGARRLFKRTFGSKAQITPANLTKAEGAGLSIKWLTDRLCGADVVDAEYARSVRGLPHQTNSQGVCPACEASNRVSRRLLLRLARG